MGRVRVFGFPHYNGDKSRKGGIPVDWNAIKAEYISSGKTYKELAAEYGVSENTLRRRAGKEKWRQSRHKSDTETTQKIIDSVSDAHSQNAKEIAEKIDDSAKLIAEKIYAALLNETTAYDIQSYTRALKTLKEIAGIKSALDIQEQKARIANLEKQARDDDTKDRVYTVVFGEAKDYIG